MTVRMSDSMRQELIHRATRRRPYAATVTSNYASNLCTQAVGQQSRICLLTNAPLLTVLGLLIPQFVASEMRALGIFS